MSKKKKKKQNYKRHFEKYQLLVTARNFHYENFNKWLTYFYVANAAIFVGYIEIISTDPSKVQFDQDTTTFGILLFGTLAGLLLFWSSKGYYYWNINFIMMVNHYEKSVLEWEPEKRIYASMANKGIQNNYLSPLSGANYSTSKIAIFFAFCIAVAWGALTFKTMEILPKEWHPLWEISICIIGSVFSVSLFGQITWLITHCSKNKEQREREKRVKKEMKEERKRNGTPKKYWFLASNTDPLHNLEIEQ